MTHARASESDPIRLLDSTGRPVPFAEVSVVGRTGAVTTDADGFFTLVIDPAPPFQLAVFDAAGVFLGVVSVEQIGEGEGRRIFLPPLEAVEVNVHGGIAPDTLAPPAAAATVVSSADNERRQPPQLTDIVSEAPGSGTVGAGHAAVPSLRGLAGGRTLLMIDSGRVTSERRAGPSATYLDPFIVEHVEVVRGPGSVVYGSDAIGGIVHVTTPTPSTEGLTGEYRVGAGSGENQVLGGIQANVPAGDGAVVVAGYGRDFSNYDSPQGEVDNSGYENWGTLVKGLIPGRSRWVAGLQVDRVLDNGKPREDPLGSKTSYPDEQSQRLTLSAELPVAGTFSSLEFQAFLGRYLLVTERDERGGAPGGDVFTAEVEALDSSVRLLATRPLEHGAFRVGVDGYSRFDLSATEEQESFDALGQPIAVVEETSIDDARGTDLGLFGEGQRDFGSGRQAVAGGLRATYVATRNTGGTFGNQSTSEATWSGFLAYTFRPAAKWSTIAQVARGFRDPSLSDRYFVGVSGRGFIEGNPDLLPETSLQFDVAAHRTGAVSLLGVYAYLYRIEDLIERYLDVDGVFRFRNRGEEEVRGVEVEADFDWGKSLAARVTAAWLSGEILDDGSTPDSIPAPSIGVAVYGQPNERWWWRGSYSYFFRDDDPGPTEVDTPSHGLLDASTGVEVRDALQVRLILNNILDEDYPASAEVDTVPAPGRTAILVLGGTF
jgi:outer membrane receptor protein involved in Fe transport